MVWTNPLLLAATSLPPRGPLSGGIVVLDLNFQGPNGSTSIVDSSGRHAPSGTNVSLTTSTAAPDRASSLSLAGTATSQIIIPYSNDFAMGTDPWTIEAWVRETAPLSNSGVIIRLLTSSNRPVFDLYSQSTQYWARIRSGVNEVIINPSVRTTDVWTHLAFVRSSSSLALYVNGARVSSTGLTSTAALATTTNNVIVGQNIRGFLGKVMITRGLARYTESQHDITNV